MTRVDSHRMQLSSVALKDESFTVFPYDTKPVKVKDPFMKSGFESSRDYRINS